MPMRPCGLCPEVDELPRHVEGLINAAPGTPPPADHHHACGAAAGCPSCTTTIAALAAENLENDHG